MIEYGSALETDLAELLADEVRQVVVRGSGSTPGEFMQQWRGLAARLERLRLE